MPKTWRSLAEFTWSRSANATTPSILTTTLLTRHTQSKVMGFKQATGGVFPICVDESREAWCLLGENHRSELCHFHGWIDPGETFEMGAAREAYEESRGVLGDVLTIWRAICDPLFSRRCNAIVALSLGVMTVVDRERICADFLASPIVCRGMNEVRRLWWLPLRPLHRMCVGLGISGERGNKELQRNASDHDTASSPQHFLPPGLTIRPFLLQRGWLGAGGLWEHADVKQLVDTGIVSESWLPLRSMVCIAAGETAHLCNSLADTADSQRSHTRLRAPSASADSKLTKRKFDS